MTASLADRPSDVATEVGAAIARDLGHLHPRILAWRGGEALGELAAEGRPATVLIQGWPAWQRPPCPCTSAVKLQTASRTGRSMSTCARHRMVRPYRRRCERASPGCG